MIKQLLSTLTLSVLACSAGAQQALPEKMSGWWSNSASGHSNKVEVELLRMESPTQATLKVVWWPYCRWTETTAEFLDGAWVFSPQRCANNSGPMTITARLKPVEGKKRLEGTYNDDAARTVYLSWD